MPPVVAGAAAPWVASAITGAATLGGAALANRSNNKATKTQAQANSEAIAMAKDNEARRRMEYDRTEALSKQQWDAEQARLEPYRNAQNALLGQAGNRLGLNLGALGGYRTAAPYGEPRSQVGVPVQGRTLSQLAGWGDAGPQIEQVPEIQAAPKLTIADIGNWGNQRRMS